MNRRVSLWMTKCDGSGVQKVSPQCSRRSLLAAQHYWRAVKRIANHRMTERRHMHSDLVRAPGFNSDFQQGELSESAFNALQHAIVSDRAAAAAGDHAGSPLQVATNC